MRNPYYAGQPVRNFDGVRFFNPGEPITDRTLSQVLRWKMSQSAARWPRTLPVVAVVPAARINGLCVTVVGHATTLIQAAGLNILTDPVLSQRASPLSFAGPKRASPPGVSFENLPRIDVVLLSHNHYDHLDLPTLGQLHARDAPLIVTPLGNDVIVRRQIPTVNVVTGNWGAHFEIGRGAQVHIVPANHWSSRGLSDRRMALWGGFMIMTSAGLIYFAGDTGYGTGNIFRAMQRRFGAPDIALIPIGAYAPRWFMSSQHCDPSEAVQIMLDLGARRAVGIHWGTFHLTDEPVEEPEEMLRSALDLRNIEQHYFVAARPGSVWTVR
jgi:L-ascorbate metabolism protein UlaG (beta-lactamase superfamily)